MWGFFSVCLDTGCAQHCTLTRVSATSSTWGALHVTQGFQWGCVTCQGAWSPQGQVWSWPVELGVTWTLCRTQPALCTPLRDPPLSPLVLHPVPHGPLHRDGHGESLVVPGLYTQHPKTGQCKILQGGLRKWTSAIRRTSQG